MKRAQRTELAEPGCSVDELINGLKHMADDHDCCRPTIKLVIKRLEHQDVYLRSAAAADTLEDAHRRAEKGIRPPGYRVRAFYMRDNHTFKPLRPAHEVEDALSEFDAGHTGGMLCATIGGDHYGPVVHARVGAEGRRRFQKEAEAWANALPNDQTEAREE